MNDGISDAILRLRADACGLEFTGFITNARVPSPPVLEGEIWHHVQAKASGRFADGHRIETSWIANIHACGASMWVETENGSRYGILSFAPQGWIYFSNLRRTCDQIDPVPNGVPLFDLLPARHGSQSVAPGALGKIIERRLKRNSTESGREVRRAKPLRPERNPDYLKLLTEHARESIEALKSNGVNIIKHDN